MAAEKGNFRIQQQMARVAPHHDSFKALWETKWKLPCSKGEYPFLFASLEDFEPIVSDIIAKGLREPYDWDEYASMYFPKAEQLVRDAEIAEKNELLEKASELYLRASAVYRIARCPIPRSQKQKYAWGEAPTHKCFWLRKFPTTEVLIPHTHHIAGEGENVPVYFNLPRNASASNPAPFIIIITGLDGYRTELAMWAESWSRAGFGALAVEIPGTGDSPALAKDPKSPDRLWSSVLDWVEQQDGVDRSKICAWGLSTGGFYAIRMAHTHYNRLAGVVSHGGGCHYMFDPNWLNEVNHLEYPFDLANALAVKWGYGSDVNAFKREAMERFSLLKDGTLDSPNCTRLLLVNGMEDEIFPIDDYELCVRRGAPKEARFMEHAKHMAEPESFLVIVHWLYGVLGIKRDPEEVLRNAEFRLQH